MERARQVVVLAQDEARALRHNYIGTEHLLLGLLRQEEGVAARVLESLGVTLEEGRAEIARIVSPRRRALARRRRARRLGDLGPTARRLARMTAPKRFPDRT